MSALARILPRTELAMVSVPLRVSTLASRVTEGPKFFTAANRLLKEIKMMRENIHEARKDFAGLASLVGSQSAEEVENSISEAWAMERRMSELRRESKEALKRMEESMKNRSSARHALLRRLSHATDQLFRDCLNFTRDARVEMTALLAEREPPGEGPILSTPEDVRAMFRELEADENAPSPH